MAGHGFTLSELQSAIAGPARRRITSSSEPAGQNASVHWPCGCRAEGEDLGALTLLQRCSEHRTLRPAEAAEP
jgi:hypothetical protein